MKVKITPYSFLLWITTIIVAGTFLLFCAFLEKGLEITKIQDGYLSQRIVEVHLTNKLLTDDERDMLWEGIESIPNYSFAVFMKTILMTDDDEPEKNDAVFGAYFQKNMSTPPILSGRFFSKKEMRSTAQVAVIGEKFLKDTYNKDGKDFLSLRGQEFEVVGKMGIGSPSTLDNMIYIPLRTSMELYKDWRCSMTVDAKTYNGVYKALSAINPVVKMPEHIIEQSKKSRNTNEAAKSILEGNESMDNITEMYLITTLNVIIVILFSAFYWGQRKKKFIEVGHMLGFSNTSIFTSLLFEYLKITIPALLLVFAVLAMLSPMFFTYRLNILKANNIFGVLSIIVIPGLLVILFEMLCRSNKKIRKGGTK